MKTILRTVGNVLRVIALIICIFSLVSIVVSFLVILATDPIIKQIWPIYIIMAAIEILLICLLSKRNKKHKKAAYTGTFTPEAPPEILTDMRKYYTASQAQDSIRIMNESFALAQKTTTIDTFLSRLKLARQHALTLLQANAAGCKGATTANIIEMCEHVMSQTWVLKENFLKNSSERAIISAQQLKTEAGKNNRLSSYLNTLREYETEFMDVEDTYQTVIATIEKLLK